MTADELVVGQRYRLLESHGWKIGRYDGKRDSVFYVFTISINEQRRHPARPNPDKYFTTNPERDVRPMEDA